MYGTITSGAVSSIQKAGLVVSRTSKSITIDTTGGSIPLVTDMFLYMKDMSVESYGLRGYYMQFELENTATSRVQLYNVQSSIFKSNP
jgi:hypothetical protein